MGAIWLLYSSGMACVSTSDDGQGQVCRFLCKATPRAIVDVLSDLHDACDEWPHCQQVSEEAVQLALPVDKATGVAELDAEAAGLVRTIHDSIIRLQQKGMSIRTIREALLQFQSPSRLLVTGDLRILLVDYDNLEIVLTPLCKALYLLFLRHPEGFLLKDIDNHRTELLSLYAQTAPQTNPQRRMRHVDALVSPAGNSLNEKISLIQRIFSKNLDENLLPFYVISGKKGMPYAINLPDSCRPR